MKARRILSPFASRRHMRAEVVKQATFVEAQLREAVIAESHGSQGFGLCLRMIAGDHAVSAFAASQSHYTGAAA